MARFPPAVGAQDEALKEVAIGLLPLLQQLSQADDEDIECDGWKYLFLIIERHLGSEKFNKVIEEYKKRTKQ